jgi:predicted anti-sigma-YlaC factor YlaD
VTHGEIVCREFVELVTEYLDDALSAEAVELVEEHLVMCDWCRDYLAQIEVTAQAVAHAEPGVPPPELLQTLMGALRERRGEGT